MRIGNTVLLKREDNQPVFSFKLRGAYNKMAHLTRSRVSKRGVIAASAGNHAQGVALAAAERLGCRAVIVMPVTTPRRSRSTPSRARGAEVVLVGESYSDAYAHALVVAGGATACTFVHPFDDPDVIAGQGTIGMEILQSAPGAAHRAADPRDLRGDRRRRADRGRRRVRQGRAARHQA